MRRLFSFFSFRTLTVHQASVLLALTTLLSNVLGLARNLIFNRVVPGPLLDTFYASFTIADLLFNLLIFGAMGSALVPVLSELISSEREDEAHQVTNQLLSWSTLIFTLLAATLAVAMPFLMGHVVQGFEPARRALTVELSRIILLQTLLFSISFILGALLNAYRRFAGYAVAPLLYNISLIAGGLLYPIAGVRGIALGAVIGALLHCSVQYRESRRTPFRVRPNFGWNPHLTHIVKLMGPRSVAQGVSQAVVLLYTNLGSYLPKSSITIFKQMNDLQTTPNAVIASSLASAAFPTISAKVSSGEQHEVDTLFTRLVRCTLFLLIPTVALSLILRAQIVRLYFGIGGPSWSLTTLAITTFAVFTIGIIPASIVTLFGRIFYAHRDTKTPMYIAIVGAVVACTTAYTGIHTLHHPIWVLALAETCSSLVQCLLFWGIAIRRKYVHIPAFLTFERSLSYAAGSVLMAATAWATLHLVDALYRHGDFLSTTHTLGLTIQTLLAALVGVATYIGYSTLRSSEELKWIQTRRFSRNQ